jgi:hypothetical protein
MYTSIIIYGITPDDIHIRVHPQGVIAELGDLNVWTPTIEAMHELWVDVGRKIAHAQIHSYPGIDPTVEDK